MTNLKDETVYPNTFGRSRKEEDKLYRENALMRAALFKLKNTGCIRVNNMFECKTCGDGNKETCPRFISIEALKECTDIIYE